jgi:hypothetical protein
MKSFRRTRTMTAERSQKHATVEITKARTKKFSTRRATTNRLKDF